LGYGDQIIKLLKDTKVEDVNFSNGLIDKKYLNDIGEITTIKTLNLNNCDLTEIPKSLNKLKELRVLTIGNNKLLTTLPNFLSDLKQL
jgi:Leucine-rich repeat (LRR) protein